MDDLDELAEAVWGTQDEQGTPRRPPVRMPRVSPVLAMLLLVAGLLGFLSLAQQVDPDLASGIGFDVSQLASYAIVAAVLVLIIAAGVRMGTGGRR